ncbi:MAG: tripartite tricarboxylate transporter TctB family protein [Pseudomonadota bacterium]
MPKKYAELLLVGAFFVLAVLLYGSTAAYPNAVQGSTAAYVRFLAVSLGILCAIQLLLFALRAKKQSAEDSEKAKEIFHLSTSPKPFWTLLIVLLAYAGAFSYLGFYLASAIFLPVTMFLLGARSLISIILTTAGVLAFVYAVFERLLEVYMPVGSLIHW